MTCPESIKENYDFFSKILIYKTHANDMENNDVLGKYDVGCSKMQYEEAFRRITFSNMPCEKFKYLFSLKTNIHPDISNVDDYYNYINFWLNYNISGKNSDYTVSVKEFYHTLQKHDSNFDNEKKLECKLYNINNDDFENMCILNNLYSNYNNIFKDKQVVCAERASCLQYSKACYREYRRGLIKCLNKNIDCYKALNHFKNMYKTENRDVSSKAFKYSDLIDLPRDEDVYYEIYGGLNNWKNIVIMIFSILGPMIGMFVYLCKFTTFGQKFGAKRKRQKSINRKLHARMHEYAHKYDNSNEISKKRYNFPYNSVNNS
ncbi:PIR protein [Plasmodium vivax]|uniref:VIR protein n=1 Tax=Plasmodium vivax TaxID=5855 RepID=A0A565A5A1_PLAVI|nr:PIR protein [Plasmodium vivax]